MSLRSHVTNVTCHPCHICHHMVRTVTSCHWCHIGNTLGSAYLGDLFILTTFWYHLWSITEQMQGNTEYVWYLDKADQYLITEHKNRSQLFKKTGGHTQEIYCVQQISINKRNCTIHRIEIHLMDRFVYPANTGQIIRPQFDSIKLKGWKPYAFIFHHTNAALFFLNNCVIVN